MSKGIISEFRHHLNVRYLHAHFAFVVLNIAFVSEYDALAHSFHVSISSCIWINFFLFFSWFSLSYALLFWKWVLYVCVQAYVLINLLHESLFQNLQATMSSNCHTIGTHTRGLARSHARIHDTHYRIPMSHQKKLRVSSRFLTKINTHTHTHSMDLYRKCSISTGKNQFFSQFSIVSLTANSIVLLHWSFHLLCWKLNRKTNKEDFVAEKAIGNENWWPKKLSFTFFSLPISFFLKF